MRHAPSVGAGLSRPVVPPVRRGSAYVPALEAKFNMDNVPLVITVASGFVSIVMLMKTIQDARKEKALTALMPIVSIGATIAITLVYVYLTAAPIDWLLGLPLFLFGLFIGRGQGAMTQVYYRGPRVLSKANVRYLVYWGAAYIVTLLLGQFGSAALHAIGILTMLFSLGVAIGSNLILLTKRLTVKPEPVPALATAQANIARPTLLPEQGGQKPKPFDLPESTRPSTTPTQLPR